MNGDETNSKKLFLEEEAKHVLRQNDKGKWTIPAKGIYPHQWLWDSCFIAIGLATYNPSRAKQELFSLLRGQWSNGMIPHMIFTTQPFTTDDANFWKSENCPQAPKDVRTSGITQPPVLAEAASRVARRLKSEDRDKFLAKIVPPLIKHHEWLYRERDPRKNGLVLLFHPWETGLDNSPSWIEEMKNIHTPLWIKLASKLPVEFVVRILRKDALSVPQDQRVDTADMLRFYHSVNGLRKAKYNAEKILRRPHFVVESLSFNSILIRNNNILRDLAKKVGIDLPGWLIERMKLAEKALEELWDEGQGQYFHRTFFNKLPLKTSTIGTFFPLYAGTISKERAKRLVKLLKDDKFFWTKYPVPSVPLNSPYFNHKKYWQGPAWINTNWLIIDGLRRYGYVKEAEAIKRSSVELVKKSGFHEYFSPINGAGYGAHDFSWTAALILDLLREK